MAENIQQEMGHELLRKGSVPAFLICLPLFSYPGTELYQALAKLGKQTS